MKPLSLQTQKYKLVHRGEDWPHLQVKGTKDMLGILERNERYISWLQPESQKTEDQIPVLKIGEQYYQLSLRMMKCIWRHVRLHRGFKNIETALYGGQKLKIPMALYMEKIRTQRRFNLMRMEQQRQSASPSKVVDSEDLKTYSLEGQQPRESFSQDSSSSTSHTPNACSKVLAIVQRVLVPLLQAPIGDSVSFFKDCDQQQTMDQQYLQHLEALDPSSIKDRDSFLLKMSEIYDQHIVRGRV